MKTIRQSQYFNLADPNDRDDYERIPCPRCGGTGQYQYKDCYKCARYGVVYVKIEKEN